MFLVSARHSSFHLGDHWLVYDYDFVFAHSLVPSCICHASKMNQTLFDYGFKQKVELRSGDFDGITAALPKAVKLKYDSLRCSICSHSFLDKHYPDQNMKYKHSSECNTEVTFHELTDHTTRNHAYGRVQEANSCPFRFPEQFQK